MNEWISGDVSGQFTQSLFPVKANIIILHDS